MAEIDAVIRSAALRLLLMRWARALVVTLTGVLVALAVLRIAQAMGLFGVNWIKAATILPPAIVVLTLIYALLTRDKPAAVARRVDEGADLREALSTALALRAGVAGVDPAWAKVAQESAARQAKGVRLSAALPWRAPRQWPMPIIAALALVIIWVLPVPDVFGKRAQAQAAEQKKQDLKQAEQSAADAIKRVEEKLKAVAPLPELENPETPTADAPKPLSPEEIQRAAVKKLSSIKESLEKRMAASTQSQLSSATQEKLKQLRSPSSGPVAELSKQLAAGNFSAAKDALEKLLDDAKSGGMSDKDLAQAKEQLANLAKQLQELAKDKAALEQALKQAGMDPKLASATPQQLQEAIKNAQNLSQEQKEQLQAQAQAAQKSSESCNGMGQAMSQMAQGMGQQGMDQQGMQGAEGLEGQLSDLAMAQQEANAMAAAMQEAQMQLAQMGQSMGQCDSPGMGQCAGGMMGTSPWAAGQSDQPGEGQGGPGQGNGGSAGEAAAPEKWQIRKANTANTGQGPIIGTTMVEGESIKNEARQEVAAAIAAANERSTEAIAKNDIERQYQGAVKHFFQSMQRKTGGPAPAGAPADKTADKPAEQPAK